MRLTVDREGVELREDRLTVDRLGVELLDVRLTVDREELELRLGVAILLLLMDLEMAELLEEDCDGILLTELDEVDGRRMMVPEEGELREGAVVTRPLEEADEEEVEENLRMTFFAGLLFCVVEEGCLTVLDLAGVCEREEG